MTELLLREVVVDVVNLKLKKLKLREEVVDSS